MKKSKYLAFGVISFILLLNLLSSGYVLGQSIKGLGAQFDIKKEDPIGYGAIFPGINSMSSIYVDGSHQGIFSVMDWDGSIDAQETVDIKGKDISEAYPWYFDNYQFSHLTDNEYLDPWAIRWLNISAFEATNETLSPFMVNTVWNKYAMNENEILEIPQNFSIPTEIDVRIDGIGPKILKLNWLIDNPNLSPITSLQLISPSGKIVSYDYQTVLERFVESPWTSFTLFQFMNFIANERGIYRILMTTNYATSTFLRLQFIDFESTDLITDRIVYGGSNVEIPSDDEHRADKWDAEIYRVSGSKGDKYTIDIGYDYYNYLPRISLWIPCENGYQRSTLTAGTNDIYFPIDGNVFISFIDTNYGVLYRSSLLLKEIPTFDYEIGGNLTTTRISRDQRKAMEFTIEEDSFVRFNYSVYGKAYTHVNIMNSNNSFILKDSNRLSCYNLITPLDTKQEKDAFFYFYYLPAGDYETIIRNDDIGYDGVIQISSKYVDWYNGSIPFNDLSYSNKFPTDFLNIEFSPDDYYNTIKQAQWIGINITETGQYRLNTTIFASDNLAAFTNTTQPSRTVVYNSSSGTYHDFTEEALNPGESFPAFSDDTSETLDRLYIAYPQKWHDLIFKLSTLGVGTANLNIKVWDGASWDNIAPTNDGTNDFTQNGTIDLNLESPNYESWVRGTDFDIENVDERDYYWLAVEVQDFTSYTTLPYIQTLTLSNTSLNGDINMAIVRDSGYVYDDFWTFEIGNSLNLFVNNMEGYENDTSEASGGFLFGNEPYLVGLEEGYYKLLIIPHRWSYSGPVEIRFAIENYWDYNTFRTVNITSNPLIHPFEITTGNVKDPYLYNYTTYPFDFQQQMNYTEMEWRNLGAYFILECFGSNYSWTQMVVATENLTGGSGYRLFLMQDLPWVDSSGPNMEVVEITSGSGLLTNNTHEFGVFEEHFYLIFQFGTPSELVGFNIALSQYNTTRLFTELDISAPPNVPWGGILIGLIIAGVIIAVGGFVFYVRKKSGR